MDQIPSHQSTDRKIYNIGARSRILDNFDLNSSDGGPKRYDQVFDSQISAGVSNDRSYEFQRGQYEFTYSKTQQNLRVTTEN